MLCWTFTCWSLWRHNVFIALKWVPKSRVAVFYCKLMFSYFLKMPNCFSKWLIIYIQVSKDWRFLFLPIIANILLLSFLLIIDILLDVKWHFLVVLLCISLVTNYVEHLFIRLLAICVFLWRNIFHFLPLAKFGF